MQKLSTNLSLAAILVACYSQANAIDLTCSNEYGCELKTNFLKNNTYQVNEPSFSRENDRLLLEGEFPTNDDKDFNITVIKGNYKNREASSNGMNKDGIKIGRALFKVESIFKGNRITLKEGVSATLERYSSDDSAILFLGQGDTGVLEQDVTLTLGSSIEQINGEEEHGGRAVYIDQGELITQGGNIVLNGYGTEGIVSYYSNMKLDNLSILMNSDKTNGISASGNVNLEGNNLSITGNKDRQIGIEILREDQENDININLSNSKIALNDKSTVFSIDGTDSGEQENVSPSKINIKNSHLSSGSFFKYITMNVNDLDDEEYPKKDAINIQINGGEIKANRLVDMNDQEMLNSIGTGLELINTLDLKIQTDQGAKLQGVSYINPNYQHGTVGLTLNGNSQWKFKGDSTLDNLSVNNSTVEFEPDSVFHTLTINQDLSGSGEFILNSDLASEKADQIIVKGSVTGDHRLQVRNSRNEPKKENGKVILVKTNSGDGTFSLKDKPYVDAGIYRYELAKDNNNWVLAHKGKSADTEEPQPQPQP
ncbi:pertactin-like passenger domain-containing protein, partial [Avibacterium avium]